MGVAEGAGIEASVRYTGRIIPHHLRLIRREKENEIGIGDMGIWGDPQRRTKNPADRRTAMDLRDLRDRSCPQHRTWRGILLPLFPTPV